jgi:hypothetical protein
MTTTRRKAVVSQLRDDRKSRAMAARDYRAVVKATQAQRSKATETQLALYRRGRLALHRHRLELAAAQRRQLATFMAGLTANVDGLRVGFRAELESARTAQRRQLTAFARDLTISVGAMRSGFRTALQSQRIVLKAAARGVQQKLDDAKHDRQGASDAWRGRKPVRSALHAPGQPHRTEHSRPAEVNATAPPPTLPAAGDTSRGAPHETRQHAPSQSAPSQRSSGTRQPDGSSTPTAGGKLP